MVSSGTVLGNLNTIKSIGSKYSSEIEGLSGSWEGPSHDNIVSQSESFISEYMSTIASQMNAFANACDLYEQYKTAKENAEISESNYQKAVAQNDTSSANEFSAAVTRFRNEANQLKTQIEAQLKAAASGTLTATANSYAINPNIPSAAAASDESSSKTNTPLATSMSQTSTSSGSTGSGSYSSSGGGSYSSGGGSYSYGGGGGSYLSGSSYSGSSSSSSSYSGSSTPTVKVSGTSALNGNVIDTSEPVGTGTKYNLSESDLNYLAYVAMREQGSVEGAKLELSLMANLYEKNKNSGWFGSSGTSNYYYPGDGYVDVVRDVLVDGNRYLASEVVEHDCLSDISSISTGSSSNRSDYIPGETVIHNVYGADYVFVGFAPNGGDPFGYLV